MKTQGFLLIRTGGADKAFKLVEIEIPVLQEDDVLIEAEAFGLNYADVMLRYGLHSDKPKIPCVIGYEAVGKVIKVGNSVDNSLLGKRVIAITRLGAYAKHVIADINTIAEIGENISAGDALALALQGVTAYYLSSYITPIKKGENVLIHASAGGVGTLLLQIAKHAGAKAIAKVSSDAKCEICFNLGADLAINYKTHNYAHEIENFIGKNNLDVSFNPIGGKTFKQDLKLLSAGSRMILFGGADLKMGKFGVFSKLSFVCQMGVIIPILQTVSAKSFIGVNILSFLDTKTHVIKECLEQVITLKQQCAIKPINGGDFNFTELVQAHSLLEHGSSIGKIAVFW